MTRSALLARWAELTGTAAQRDAIVDERETSSFAVLGTRTRAVAHGIRRLGLAGERVAMLATQGSRWVESFMGILGGGAVAVPLSPLHPEVEQRWFVSESRSRAIVVSEELAHLVSGYSGGLEVLVVDDLRARPCASGAGCSAEDDVAAILYTSGTTGKPKGALITHRNLVMLARLLASAWQWRRNDTLMHTLPLHHLHGLGISLLVSLLAGGRTRMMERFDPERVWEGLGHCSVLMGVPTMHKKLLDAFDDAGAATRDRWSASAQALRLVTSGSAALPESVGEGFRALTGDYPLERFGMTEIGVGLTNPIEGPRIPGTCGRPLAGMDVRIVAEDGGEAPPGEPGEIWVRGPTVFKGYDHLEEITDGAFTDGWFRSGDTATWTHDGYARILGRTSVDILKSGGYKLSALEIEEVLRAHEAIGDVAVVGQPDETWGEIAVAAVIPREAWRGSVDETRVRSWAKQRIASYKVPKRVIEFAELPRNPVGKVIKPELARMVADRIRHTR